MHVFGLISSVQYFLLGIFTAQMYGSLVHLIFIVTLN